MTESQKTLKANAIRQVQEIIASHPAEQPFKAQDILAAQPEIRECRSAAVDLIYEEWLHICNESDTPPDVRLFAKQFPGFEHTIVNLLQVDENLQQHPSLLDKFLSPEWPHVGDIFNENFELVEYLGTGALSRVFLARQRDVANRTVIAKICLRGDYEAQFLGRFNHPAIETIYSIHDAQDSALSLICMPFRSRVTLLEILNSVFKKADSLPESRLKLQAAIQSCNQQKATTDFTSNQPLSGEVHSEGTWAEAIAEIGVKILEGLQHAHEQDVLHLDIKPSNIVLGLDGLPRLIDFNLSSGLEVDTLASIGGTLPYMAPEQLAKLPGMTRSAESAARDISELQLMPQTAATDIFQLAGTLWHALTGVPPFGDVPEGNQREAAWEQFERIQSGPKKLAAPMPAGMEDALRNCLAFDQTVRPQSTEAAMEIFGQFLPKAPANRKYGFPAGVVVLVLVLAAYWNLRPTPFENGMASLDAGRYAAAIEQLTYSIKDNQDVDAATFARGRAHILNRDWESALVDLEAVKHIPAAQAGIGYCIAQQAWQKRGVTAPDARKIIKQYQSAIDNGFSNVFVEVGMCSAVYYSSPAEWKQTKWYRKTLQIGRQSSMFIICEHYRTRMASKRVPAPPDLKLIRRLTEDLHGNFQVHSAALRLCIHWLHRRSVLEPEVEDYVIEFATQQARALQNIGAAVPNWFFSYVPETSLQRLTIRDSIDRGLHLAFENPYGPNGNQVEPGKADE